MITIHGKQYNYETIRPLLADEIVEMVIESGADTDQEIIDAYVESFEDAHGFEFSLEGAE